jgi:methionine-gamma-lyase
MKKELYGFATNAVQAGELVDPTTRALNTPIYQTATFAFDTTKEKEAAVDNGMNWVPDTYFYSRTANPTTAALEQKLKSMEGAEDVTITACGMSAVTTALLSILDSGDHFIGSEDLFTVTKIAIDDVLTKKGIESTRLDTNDLESVKKSIKPNTKLIYVESLSNPHLIVTDIKGLAELAHDNGLLLIVDNTFLSPYLLRPLELGADMVVHSATKYICGHGDALGGVVAGRKELINEVRYYGDCFGTVISPFNSWLILRGLRTLHLRMQAHSHNAQKIAEFLESRPEVEEVIYPGLASHPAHDMANELLPDGKGGMVSFYLKGGGPAMEKLGEYLNLYSIGVSLGDVRSLYYPNPKKNNLVRLSVGCEDVRDLIADLEQGLDKLDK